jgi:hypothetical protein
MPRIFGLNPLAVLVAGIVFFITGGIWYGALFSDLWVGLWGFTEEEIAAAEAGTGPAMAMGFALSIIFAGVLSFTLKALKADGMMSAIKWSVFLWAGFVVTTMAYNVIYALQPLLLLVLDAAHNLIGFVVMAAVLTVMDKIAVKD